MILRWTVILCSVAFAWAIAVVVNRRNVRLCDGSGEPGSDLIIFVEPVRWLFIIWGFAPFCRGLRLGGCGAEVQLFRWSTVAGALFVIPDLVGHGRLKRRADRLARKLEACARQWPGRRIHVVGYSSGSYIAMEACKRLTNHDDIGSVVTLANTVSPHYALGDLVGRIQRLHSFHSPLDLINIVGPLLFGSNDRRWGRAAGAAGFCSPPDLVVQHPWQPEHLTLGYLGGHFTVIAPRFVARHMACLFRDPKFPRPVSCAR